jgi:hypothetical protein
MTSRDTRFSGEIMIKPLLLAGGVATVKSQSPDAGIQPASVMTVL